MKKTILTMLFLAGCSEPIEMSMEDASMQDAAALPAWHCFGTFNVEHTNGGPDTTLDVDTPAEVYTISVSPGDGLPNVDVLAVRPSIEINGCTLRMSLEHGDALAEGPFDLEMPDWDELDQDAEGCGAIYPVNANTDAPHVWREGTGVPFMLLDFTVQGAGFTADTGSLYCAPVGWSNPD